MHDVAGYDPRHTLAGSGHDDVARVERVPGRPPADLASDAHDHHLRDGSLADFAVGREAELEPAGCWYLVGGDEPRPRDRIGVDRLAEAAILRSAHHHVERDAIAGDVIERAALVDIVGEGADDDAKLHLVVGAPIRKTQLHAFARTDQRTRRLQEQALFLDAA